MFFILSDMVAPLHLYLFRHDWAVARVKDIAYAAAVAQSTGAFVGKGLPLHKAQHMTALLVLPGGAQLSRYYPSFARA